jgi:ABC-type phosphate/phosphonate transport system substrate-binding protein
VKTSLAAFLLLAVGSFASIALAQASSREIVVIYPGGPGDQTSAKSTMDSFAEYLAHECGFGDGSLAAIYFNDEKAATKHGEEKKPSFGILTLEVYLRWRGAGKKMTLVAQSERRGQLTEQYHLLVPEGSSVAGLQDLKGKTVASSYLEDRRFASKVVFENALDASSDVAIVTTRSTPRSTLRAVATAKKLADGRVLDGMVVDDFQFEGMKDLPEMKKLKRVWSSRPMPTPAVVAFDDAATGAEIKKLEATLTAMSLSVAGKNILERIQATGFKPASADSYAPFEKAY